MKPKTLIPDLVFMTIVSLILSGLYLNLTF